MEGVDSVDKPLLEVEAYAGSVKRRIIKSS